MATLAGALTPSILEYHISMPWGTIWAPQYSAATTVLVPFVNTTVLAGTKTDTQPVTELGLSKVGASLPGTGWGSILWGNVLVYPVSINYSFLQANRDDNITLWNTNLSASKNLTSVTAPPSGIVLDLPSLPQAIEPLDEYTLQVHAYTAGPAEIANYLYFTFTDNIGSLYLYGTRTLVFAFMPEYPWKERLEWATDVNKTYRGWEERTQLRQDPARYIEADFFVLSGHENSYFEAMMTGGHLRAFVLPVWAEMTQYVGTLSAGVSEIAVDTTNKSYEADGYLVLIQDYCTFEVVEITSVTDTKIILKGPTLTTHINPMIAPTFTAKMTKNPSVEDMFQDVAKAKLEFRATTPEAITSVASATQYRGYDVYTGELLLRNNQLRQKEVTRDYEIIDYGVGAFEVLYGAEWSSLQANTEIYASSRAEAWALRQWLHRRAGQYLPFWIRTYKKQIDILTSFGADTVTFQIRNINYVSLLTDNPIYLNLVAVKLDGTVFYRNIVGSTFIDNEIESLTLESSFGFAGTMADFKTISFLSLVRLSEDKVEITWDDYDQVTATFGIIGVGDDED